MLYQYDVRGDRPERLYDELREREGYRVDPYTVDRVAGVLADTEALDGLIARYSHQWPVERLAPLERNVLRLAVHEIEAGAAPPEVAVDEAVRLARRYSTDEAGALVNGILGAFLRDRAAGDEGTPPETADEASASDAGDDAPASRTVDEGPLSETADDSHGRDGGRSDG